MSMIDNLNVQLWKNMNSSGSSKEPIFFIGWIAGKEEHRNILRELGVKGLMSWEPYNDLKIDKRKGTSQGIFVDCVITLEVAKVLKDKYPYFSSFPFTGFDEDNHQTKHQPLWEGHYD